MHKMREQMFDYRVNMKNIEKISVKTFQFRRFVL